MYVMHLGDINEFPADKYPVPGYQQQAPTPAPTPAPTGAPAPTIDCNQAIAMWRQYNPQKDACLTDKNRRAMVRACTNMKAGLTTPQQAGAQINHIADVACAARNTSPPALTPPTPPPTSTPLPGGGGSNSQPSSGGGGDTGMPPVTQSKSALKTWGPIVGIGLLAAVGLTLARNTGKKKSRSKR